MDGPEKVVQAFIDLRSPYSYLALGPAREIERRYGARFEWWPFITDFRAAYGGKVEERTARDLAKVKYLYMDCRRLAKLQRLTIRSTVKLWDATLGSQALLLAKSHGKLWEFLDPVLASFWRREFDLESAEDLGVALANAGLAKNDWSDFLVSTARTELEAALAYAEQLRVFGAPTFVYEQELFWGGDRLAMLSERLSESAHE